MDRRRTNRQAKVRIKFRDLCCLAGSHIECFELCVCNWKSTLRIVEDAFKRDRIAPDMHDRSDLPVRLRKKRRRAGDRIDLPNIGRKICMSASGRRLAHVEGERVERPMEIAVVFINALVTRAEARLNALAPKGCPL